MKSNEMLVGLMLGSVVLWAGGCVEKATSHDPFEYEQAAEPERPSAETKPAVPRPEIARAAMPTLDFGATATVHYVNVTLVVDDPVEALGRAEALLTELNGEIQHSSTHAGNANFSAFLPPEARSEFRKSVTKLGRVSNESSSSNDITHEVRRLRRRSSMLAEADYRVAQSFGTSPDADAAEALALMRELTQRERQSVQMQLQNYERQLRFAQVNISFTKVDPTASR
jgi:hypothetical protein